MRLIAPEDCDGAQAVIEVAELTTKEAGTPPEEDAGRAGEVPNDVIFSEQLELVTE